MSAAGYGAVAGAGMSLAGALMAQGEAKKEGAPQMRRYAREANRVAKQYIPSALALESVYGPMFNALQERNLTTNLFGSSEGLQPWTMPRYTSNYQLGTARPTGLASMTPSGVNAAGYSTFTRPTATAGVDGSRGLLTREYYQPEQQGLMSIYGQALAGAQQLAGNPYLDALLAERMGDVSLGTSLSAAQQREAQQYARAGAAARGMAYGPSSAFEELLTLGSRGEALRQQRLAGAEGLLPMTFNQQQSERTLAQNLLAAAGAKDATPDFWSYLASSGAQAPPRQGNYALANWLSATGSQMMGMGMNNLMGGSQAPPYGSTYGGYGGQLYQSVNTGAGGGISMPYGGQPFYQTLGR